MIKILLAAITAFALVLTSGGLIPQASAQVSISLFPLKFRITVEPGTSFSDKITVINPNDFSIGVKAEVENLKPGEEGAIDLSEMDIPYGLMKWVEIDRQVFTLAPQERRQIPFSVNIPENGEPGGHYGAILFRAIPPPGGEGGIMAISGRVGSVLLVEVPGETVKTGEISEFTGPSYMSRGPTEFIFKVKNTGNTHYFPEGKIVVDGIFAKRTELDFESRVVFPGYSRTYKAVWPVRYAFGPITATALINIPDSGSRQASFTLFAFPWQEGSAVLALIILIWLGSRVFRKKFKIVRV